MQTLQEVLSDLELFKITWVLKLQVLPKEENKLNQI